MQNRLLRVVLFFSLSFLAISSQANNDYRMCEKNLIENWILLNSVPIGEYELSYFGSTSQQTIVKYYSNHYSELCFDESEPGCYCTGEGADQDCKKYIEKRKTLSKKGATSHEVNFSVLGQNPSGTADLSFEKQGHFFKIVKTKFGTGKVDTDFSCCFPQAQVTVDDKTSGFQHSFPTGKLSCQNMKQEMLKQAQSEGKKIRFTEVKEQFCKDFDRRVRSWSKSEKKSCSLFGDPDRPTDFICNKKIIKTRFRGCQPIGSKNKNIEEKWRYSASETSEISNSSDQDLILNCTGLNKIGLTLTFPSGETAFLKSISDAVDAGNSISVKAWTNRSQVYQLSSSPIIDLQKKSIQIEQEADRGLIASLRADRNFIIELKTSNSKAVKELKFSLKGSGRVVKKLQVKCSKK